MRARLAMATALGLALCVVCGCGKSDLRTSVVALHTTAHRRPSQPAPPTTPGSAPAPSGHPSTPPTPSTSPPMPTPAQAAEFARAVDLTSADVVGGHQTPRRPERRRDREAQECGATSAATLGGAESPRFVRGRSLDREVISSAVAVLPSAALAREDLESVLSHKGLECYAKVVRRSVGRSEGGLRLVRLRVSPLRVQVSPSLASHGIRVAARIASTTTTLTLPLYIDALVFQHAQSEIELYASSYVQPEPTRTEQELLALMAQRAQQHGL